MKPRARKSSQTDWPCFSSSLTGFMMPCSVRAGGFQHLFWPEAELCQQILEAGADEGEVCVSRPDNAIHNISIPEIGCLAENPGAVL
jgi:hypothetical protein